MDHSHKKFEHNAKQMSKVDTEMGLADQLKVATGALHLEAEKTGVIQGILKRNITKPEYEAYLLGLYFIYETLEVVLSQSERPEKLAFLSDQKIFRHVSIREDLKALGVNIDVSAAPKSDSIRRYCQFIERQTHDNPMMIIGLAYVRYLGDLNGGRILKTCLTKAIDIPDDALSFYDFPLIHDLEAYKESYRKRLNTLSMAPKEVPKIIQAARFSFEMNIAFSKEVCI